MGDNVYSLVSILTNGKTQPDKSMNEMFQVARAEGPVAVATLGNQIGDWLLEIDKFDRLSLYSKGLLLYHLQTHWGDYVARDAFEDVPFDAWCCDKFGTNWRMWVTVVKKWILNCHHIKWVESLALVDRLAVPPSKANRLSKTELVSGITDRQLDALFNEHISDRAFRAILATTEEDDLAFLEHGSRVAYEYSRDDKTFFVWAGDVRKPAMRVLSSDQDVLDFVDMIVTAAETIRLV